MASTGWRAPTSNTVEAGSGTWTNDTNIRVDDGAEATLAIAAKNTTGRWNSATSFGFDSVIPTGATIDSVEIRAEWRCNTAAGIGILELQAFVGGNAVGAVRENSDEPTTLTTDTFNITADRSWTRSDLLNANFALKVRGRTGNNATDPSFRVDHVAVQVNYTPQAFTLACDGFSVSASVQEATLTYTPVAGGPLTFYLRNEATVGDGNAAGWEKISETPVAAATLSTGWVVGTGNINRSELASRTQRASSTFVDYTPPDGTLDTTLKDAFRTDVPYNGSFAAGDWSGAFAVRSPTNGGAADGLIRFNIIKADADGGNATFIDGPDDAQHVTNVGNASDSNGNFFAGYGAFSVSNQYLFFQIAWERTGAGSNPNTNIRLRAGVSPTEGTRIITTAFTSAGGFTLPAEGFSVEATVSDTNVGAVFHYLQTWDGEFHLLQTWGGVVEGVYRIVGEGFAVNANVEEADLQPFAPLAFSLEAASLAVSVNVAPSFSDTEIEADGFSVSSSVQDATLTYVPAGGVFDIPADSLAVSATVQDVTLTYVPAGGVFDLQVDALDVAVTVQDAGLRAGLVLSADVLSVSATVQDATLRAGRRMAADALTVSAAIQDATLTYVPAGAVFDIQADALFVALTVQDATLKVGRALVADSLAVQASVQDVTLTQGSIGAFSIAADALSVSAAVQDAGIGAGRRVAAEALASSVAVQDATLEVSRRVQAEALSVTAGVQDATITFAQPTQNSISADLLAVTATVQDATLAQGRRLAADPLAVSVAVQDAAFSAAHRLQAEGLAVTAGVADAFLTAAGHTVFPADPLAVAVSVFDAGLRRDAILQADPLSVTADVDDAGLIPFGPFVQDWRGRISMRHQPVTRIDIRVNRPVTKIDMGDS